MRGWGRRLGGSGGLEGWNGVRREVLCAVGDGIACWREEGLVEVWCADNGMVSLCVFLKRAIYYCVWYKVSPRVLVVLFYPF